MSNLNPDQFKRVEGGYLHPSGDVYLERMARMSSGGTNGWAIHSRTPEHEIGTDDRHPYHTKTGETLREINGVHYHHSGDEGSLADAKYVVRQQRNSGESK